MRYCVLGLGVSGKAVIEFLEKSSSPFIVVDQKEPESGTFPFFLESAPPQLEGVTCLVKSPGIPLPHPWVVEAKERGIQIVGEIDLALEVLAKKNKTVLGITGSNGKTTTTLLTTHLLQQRGIEAVTVGNIGTPLLSQVENRAEVFVVELSSFQLSTLVPRPSFDRAVILNITPNHLDWHASFEEYSQAKFRLFSALKKGGKGFIPPSLATCGSGWETTASWKQMLETIFSLEYRVGGNVFLKHDLENLAAACCLLEPSREEVKEGMRTFRKPPHRLEFVRKVRGVSFFNDSKATSVDAVEKALEALEGPLLLLAGGVDKGGDYRKWIPLLRENVKRVFAMGGAANRMVEELSTDVDIEKVVGLEEGLERAISLAQTGDTVLLSPGCSSFDQFRNFEERGEVFKKWVWEKVYE
ncbi:MAG: UDP-N-acetylmuramoylalanine--D-glutamate ligase [Chlamydiae bacterium]|nr:UDP-N-acetylmuramoylalanine--D-glutamate ligase [Chlamydiota bacterium]